MTGASLRAVADLIEAVDNCDHGRAEQIIAALDRAGLAELVRDLLTQAALWLGCWLVNDLPGADDDLIRDAHLHFLIRRETGLLRLAADLRDLEAAT